MKNEIELKFRKYFHSLGDALIRRQEIITIDPTLRLPVLHGPDEGEGFDFFGSVMHIRERICFQAKAQKGPRRGVK